MDIVEWLRLWAPSVSPKLDEAADEIEYLKKRIIDISKDTERFAAAMYHYSDALNQIYDIADQCGEPISSKLAHDALTKKV
jgi:hypothetical protein